MKDEWCKNCGTYEPESGFVFCKDCNRAYNLGAKNLLLTLKKMKREHMIIMVETFEDEI